MRFGSGLLLNPAVGLQLRLTNPPPVIRQNGSRPARASVLLEVILALALFVIAAAIVTSGMNASTDNLERQRRNTHAVNLAATVLAEIQLGIRPISEAGEQPFLAPFDLWTSELVVSPAETETGEAAGLLRVEVIIRHKESTLVHRLAQVIRIPQSVGAAF